MNKKKKKKKNNTQYTIQKITRKAELKKINESKQVRKVYLNELPYE